MSDWLLSLNEKQNFSISHPWILATPANFPGVFSDVLPSKFDHGIRSRNKTIKLWPQNLW